uniref:Protein kinase domain-containing protein n=1 Tax=Kalanchoe fedtschenkoi TaxID=63787 RepID=A0A7N0R908_KALFE
MVCTSMADNPTWLSLVVALVALHFVVSASESEQEILLKFKDSLKNNEKLSSWNASTSPCANGAANWVGVICTTGGSVYGLKLEIMGLSGELNLTPLKGLASLRTISLKKNSLSGSLPSVNQLGALKSVFLSHNNFSGEIADGAFYGMMSLKKVDLGHNRFVGKIPVSLAKLPRLLELRLENNHFQCQIPSFASKNLAYLNVANNELDGSIPEALRDLDRASFSGNKNLCGGKLPACPERAESAQPLSGESVATNTTSLPPPARAEGHHSYKVSLIMGAVIVGIILLITVIVYVIKSRPSQAPDSVEAPAPERTSRAKSGEAQADAEAGPSMTNIGGGKKDHQQTKLTFLKDTTGKFDLQDLLKASAEILGSGVFGSSFKANISPNGATMVVKRYRQMNNMDKEEFQEHMRRLGRLDDPNLLPLVAFYYRKEEKLMITEFVSKGNLASYLHGKHDADKASLDWPTRLKIVKGVAKGLSVLYRELPSLTTPHGHLKSSNILLSDSFEPLLTDFGLVPLVNQEHAQKLMIAYKSPEYVQHGRITKKTDVWALGVLILEVLTGKFPANFSQGQGEKEFDLALWVNNMVDEDHTREVFDEEMKHTENSEGEMLKLLNVGLACCRGEVEARLDFKEAAEKIEELKEKDNDEEFYSTYGSKGKSDDFNSSLEQL